VSQKREAGEVVHPSPPLSSVAWWKIRDFQWLAVHGWVVGLNLRALTGSRSDKEVGMSRSVVGGHVASIEKSEAYDVALKASSLVGLAMLDLGRDEPTWVSRGDGDDSPEHVAHCVARFVAASPMRAYILSNKEIVVRLAMKSQFGQLRIRPEMQKAMAAI
jgi:hypothetical protein